MEIYQKGTDSTLKGELFTIFSPIGFLYTYVIGAFASFITIQNINCEIKPKEFGFGTFNSF